VPSTRCELARLRDAGPRVAERSAIWRSQRDAIAEEQDRADRLELIASASVMLARAALEVSAPARSALVHRMQELSSALERLADAPGDRGMRQQAVASLLAASRADATSDAPDQAVAAAFAILDTIARDLLIFAGLTSAQATEAMRAGVTTTEVPQPPATPRLPFGFGRRHVQ
jgi:hypothetical protein